MNREEALAAIPNIQTKLSLAMNDLHQSLNRVRTMPDEAEFYDRYSDDMQRVKKLQAEMSATVDALHPSNQPTEAVN